MSDQDTGINTMWGGRFAAGPDAVMAAINQCVDVDRHLAMQDLAGSMAHARMLMAQGIVTAADGVRILEGLAAIQAEIVAGTFRFDPVLEDVHMNVESRLRDLIGDAAGRLHTARSRNDQVATDMRLWVRDALDAVDEGLQALQAALIDRAEDHADAVMPGFTHLQTAQPVTFGHHLLAYVEMLGRDRGRAADCRRRTNESPLGAAALAGTSFPIDREATARDLGFVRPMANSLDAVSARDFALEFLSVLAICGTHLSRLAEEIVIFAAPPFGLLRLSDGFSTGSSIMPQKRNPDAAELVRAKAGTLIGELVGLLGVMKGLPLAYAKDMQDTKPPLLRAADTMALCVAAMTGMVRTLTADRDRMAMLAGQGYSTATDLADWLVRVLGMPFRDAHHVTGAIVAKAEAAGVDLADLPLETMQAIEPRITSDVFSVLTVQASVASRTSYGGTAPGNVRAQVALARQRFLAEAPVESLP